MKARNKVTKMERDEDTNWLSLSFRYMLVRCTKILLVAWFLVGLNHLYAAQRDSTTVQEPARKIVTSGPRQEIMLPPNALKGVTVKLAEAQSNTQRTGGNAKQVGTDTTDWIKTNGPYDNINNNVYSLAINASGYIFAGTDAGVYLSTDEGGTWAQTSLGAGLIGSLVINSAGYVFAGNPGGGVSLSENNGANWTVVNNGLTNLNVRSLAINSYGIVYAGTDAGVYYSTNDGSSWTPLSGIINYQVLSIATTGSLVLFGTNGRGVYLASDTGNSVVVDNLASRYVFTLAIDASGYVIAGTDDGAYSSTNPFGISGKDISLNIWTQVTTAIFPLSFAINSLGQIFGGTKNPGGVYYSADSGRSWSQMNNGLTNSSVQSIAVDSRGYVFVGTNGGGVYRSVNSTTSAPQPPSLASPANGSTGVSANSMLTWNASAGATSYGLQVSTDSTFATTTYDMSGLPPTSKSITGLSAQTKYYWRVDATNAGGTSGWSSIWSYTTASVQPAPTPPTLASPTNGSTGISTNPTVTWNASAGATSYRLQGSTDSTFATTYYDTSGITDTTKTISNLSNSTKYYWRVNASDSNQTSVWSDVWSFTTVAGAPLVPALISPANGATGVSTNPVFVWGSSPGVAGYVLNIGDNPIAPRYSYTSTDTFLTVSGLSKGTTYYWNVCIYYDGEYIGNPVWSFTTFTYPSSIRVSMTFTPPGTMDQTSYRIVGLPGAINLPLSGLLSGNNGTDWDAYYDNGAVQDYQVKYDGTSTFDFQPGRAFWILSKDPFYVLQNDSTVPLDTSDSYPIVLHAGWNLISDPFEKSILWSTVQTLNGVSQPIYSFTGSYSTSTSFDPYTGNYFYNDQNLPSLRIPYVYSVAAASKAGDSPKKVSSVQNDVLKLSLTSKGLQALPLTVGFDPTVSDSLNKLNIFAPPDNFDDLRIQVVDQNVRGDWKDLYADFRSEIGKGQSFDVEVKNLTGRAVTVRPTLTSIFENYGVYLVDNGTHTFYDLKTTDSIAIGGAYKYKSYALLIGGGSFIDSVRAVYAPKTYELFQNYPNPFNPTTIIRYEIPKKAQVTLQVYNVLGELVRTLVNEVEQPGYYEVGFNAIGLASGVYFCRMVVSGVESTQAGNYSHIVKMVVLK